MSIPWDVIIGIAVSMVVSALKGWAPVQKYPKVAAAVLVLAVQVAVSVAGPTPSGVTAIAVSFITAVAVAMGAYEGVVKPAARAFKPPVQ